VASATSGRITGNRLLDFAFRGWTGLVFVFLYLPMLVLVAYSFNESRLNVVWTGFTTKWYGELAENRLLLQALKNSLVIALSSTLLATILGTLGAWLLHRYRFRFATAIRTLVTVPMVMPEVVLGVSLLIFFTSIALPLGFTTVIIAHVTFCFPFVMVAVQARLQGLDPALEEAALDLGATPFQAFWRVILPNLRPAIVAGALMAFTLSMDELIVTYFTYSARAATLPIRVFGMAKAGLNPMLNALSAILIVATIASVLFSRHLRKLVVKPAQ
jgi:spermidine/putrescine transport system permease protein